ncbi:MAG: tetratricopeptide repeat protein [Candidatus Wallbacteria bacterium]|nr:tetratricopeptide repeat protein [Candidatus Wallbacteria bacterium]
MNTKKTPRLFTRLGMLHLLKNEIPQAIVEFRKALLLDPTNLIALQKLANLFTLGGEHKEALKYYEKAISLSKDDLELRCGLAGCLEANEKNAESLAAYEMIQKQKPDYEMIEFHLSRVHLKLSHLDDAKKFYAEAIKRYPDDPDVKAFGTDIQEKSEKAENMSKKDSDLSVETGDKKERKSRKKK